jgi:hypothetical protein
MPASAAYRIFWQVAVKFSGHAPSECAFGAAFVLEPLAAENGMLVRLGLNWEHVEPNI